MNQNATREQIVRALRTGRSDAAIARDLCADRCRIRQIRRSLGLPPVPKQPQSLQQKWQARTRPVVGGHLEWTGERQRVSGTPVMRYRGTTYTAAQIAFRIQHGREPQGYAFADCGMWHCVAPAHVEDEITRATTRAALRLITGRGERPDRCPHGHDQAEHGRYEADGRPYCRQCKADRKAVSPACS